nr:GNAT family N-acetyltransferase [Paenibacillus sp. 1001270B_150601_E10]
MIKTIKATTEVERQAAFAIRKEVFVEEQGVPLADEFDQYDQANDNGADHILVYIDEAPVGTGRLRVVEGMAKLERICILKSQRKHGIGRVIISALEQLSMDKGLSKAKLHGQKQAEGFYQKLGYYTASDVFMEDGIEHVLMMKELS